MNFGDVSAAIAVFLELTSALGEMSRRCHQLQLTMHCHLWPPHAIPLLS